LSFQLDGTESRGPLAKEMRQCQAAHLAAAQPTAGEQHAESFPLFTVLFPDRIILIFVGVAVAEALGQSHAAQLTAAQRPTAQQQSEGFPLVTVFFLYRIILIFVGVAVAEELGQSQATQLAAAQHPAAQQQAEALPVLAFVILCLGIFNIVSLSKQVRQQETSHPTFTQQFSTKQQTQGSALFAFTLLFVYYLFSFHVLAPCN
jgi:Na+/proline symporter